MAKNAPVARPAQRIVNVARISSVGISPMIAKIPKVERERNRSPTI